MFKYNIPKPHVYEVENTVRSFEELRNINGQNYITITAAEGRKLMQRIQTQPDNLNSIERVLAKGHDTAQDDENVDSNKPDFILVESKDYVKKKHRSQNKNAIFSVLRETSALQFQSLGFYQAVLAEFIGVYILTFAVCGLGLSFDPNESVPSINGCLGGGLCLATMIWCTNCISGGNLNPAISVVLVLTNDLDPTRGIFYIIFQLLGAVLGSLTLDCLVPNNVRLNLGVTQVNDKISLFNAYGIEVIITFLLAFTVFACIDKKRKDLGGSFPLAIGLSVTAGALFGV